MVENKDPKKSEGKEKKKKTGFASGLHSTKSGGKNTGLVGHASKKALPNNKKYLDLFLPQIL